MILDREVMPAPLKELEGGVVTRVVSELDFLCRAGEGGDEGDKSGIRA
jgi:hypothetical protein